MSTEGKGNNRVVLTTGASSGFGKACAHHLSERALGIMEHAEKTGPPPGEVACLLEKILGHPSPGLRYPVGKFSERFTAGIKAFLPGKVYEWMIMKTYKLR